MLSIFSNINLLSETLKQGPIPLVELKRQLTKTRIRDLRRVDKDGALPLHYACGFQTGVLQSPEVIEALVDTYLAAAEAKIAFKDTSGYTIHKTALHFALTNGAGYGITPNIFLVFSREMSSYSYNTLNFVTTIVNIRYYSIVGECISWCGSNEGNVLQ